MNTLGHPTQLHFHHSAGQRRSGSVGGAGTALVSMVASLITHAGGEATHTLNHSVEFAEGLRKADFYAHQVWASAAVCGQRSSIKFPLFSFSVFILSFPQQFAAAVKQQQAAHAQNIFIHNDF